MISSFETVKHQQSKSTFCISLALGLLPTILIAYLINTYLLDNKQNILFIIVGLYLFYFFVWVCRSAYQFVYYKIIGKKILSDFFLEFLIQNKFPVIPDFFGDIDDYFSDIIYDINDVYSVDLKNKAIEAVSFVRTPAQLGFIQIGLRVKYGFNNALERYSKHDL